MLFDKMTQLVGNTPYIHFQSDEVKGANLFIKMEGYNPSGSIKDRACYYIINSLVQEGKLSHDMKLLDASSGNFASALAYYGKIMGFRTEVVVSSKITREKRSFIDHFGAKITQIGNFTIDGNRYCRELVESDTSGTYYFLDQLHNWKNPEAHFRSTGPEILKAFPEIDAVVGSLGSGGTMLGVGRYLKSTRPVTKIIAVQAASGTSIPGTGSFDDGDYITPFIKEGIDKGIFDHIVKIDMQGAMKRCKQLCEKGIFCGLQTGAVLDAALTAADQGIISGNIVVISGDSGWKNLERLNSPSHAQ